MQLDFSSVLLCEKLQTAPFGGKKIHQQSLQMNVVMDFCFKWEKKREMNKCPFDRLER